MNHKHPNRVRLKNKNSFSYIVPGNVIVADVLRTIAIKD